MVIGIRHLIYFVAAAEELHFGRGAERVNVTTSSMSEQIKQLERIIDIRLFDRTTRTVHLTLAGAVFLEQARLILTHVEAAVRLARAVAPNPVAPKGRGVNGQ